MVIILAEKESARLKYILHHIFDVMLGHPFRLCFDREEVAAASSAAPSAAPSAASSATPSVASSSAFQPCVIINYTATWMPEALYLPPHALLFETGIREQNPQDFDIHGEMGCFPVADARSDFPMDIFAACFYFLSRYEEYLPFTPDKHGRFRAEESWAYRKNVLDKALVDRWVDLLRRKLSAVCPALSFKQPASTFLPTYDIDVAFAYAHKSVAVQFASMCKSLLKGDFREMGSRWRVWTGKEQDPYDVYDWLSELHRQYGLHPLYFVLFASRSRYDRGLPPKNATFVRWLRHVAWRFATGRTAELAGGVNRR